MVYMYKSFSYKRVVLYSIVYLMVYMYLSL